MRIDKNLKNTRMAFVVADATYDVTLSSPLGKRASHGRLKTVISAVPAPKAIRAINHACCTSLINSHADTIYNKEWLLCVGASRRYAPPTVTIASLRGHTSCSGKRLLRRRADASVTPMRSGLLPKAGLWFDVVLWRCNRLRYG